MNLTELEIRAPNEATMPEKPSEMVLENTDKGTDQSDSPEPLPMESTESTEPEMSTFTLSQYRQAIIDRYKDDTQFSKALKTGVDSGIYKVENGLLYLATGRDQKLCIPNIRVKGGRDKGMKSL